MISVAICDDNINDLKLIKSLVEDLKKAHEDSYDLFAFSSPKDLIKKINSGSPCDVYILETVYKEMSGIELARFIKQNNKHSKIAFITYHKEYAVDAFELDALHYAIKPCTVSFIQELYERIVREVKDIDHYIVKRTSSGIVKVDTNSIMYTESSGHYQYLYLENGESLKIRSKTSELWKELKEHSCFLRPHSGYIVNMNYISSVSSSGIKIKDVELPMAKNTLNKISKIFMEYGHK